MKPRNQSMIFCLARLAAGLLLTAQMTAAPAQQSAGKTTVFVQGTADDPIGRLLVYEVREAVRRSSGLLLTDRGTDARFTLRIVTIDADGAKSAGISTVYSAVYTMRSLGEDPVEMYLTNTVGTCGSSRVESCARRMTATLDEQVVEFRTALRNALDSANRSK